MKLFIFDLDGTLLDNSAMLKKNTIEQLKMLKENGNIICLASGRPYRSIIKYARQFGDDTPIISENGANITTIDKSISKNIKKFKIKDFIKLYSDNKEMIKSAFFSVENKVYIYNRLQKLEPLYHIDSDTIVIEGDYDKINNIDAPNGALFVVDSPRKEKFEEYINSTASKVSYRMLGADLRNAIYEISIKNHSKADAAIKLLKILKLSKNDLVFFGDGENDIELLKLANTSIAMKNANCDVKKAAKFVTEYDNNNEGVYHFLKDNNIQ